MKLKKRFGLVATCFSTAFVLCVLTWRLNGPDDPSVSRVSTYNGDPAHCMLINGAHDMGSQLAAALLSQGHKVTVIHSSHRSTVREHDSLRQESSHLRTVWSSDPCNQEIIKTQLAGGQIGTVILFLDKQYSVLLSYIQCAVNILELLRQMDHDCHIVLVYTTGHSYAPSTEALKHLLTYTVTLYKDLYGLQSSLVEIKTDITSRLHYSRILEGIANPAQYFTISKFIDLVLNIVYKRISGANYVVPLAGDMDDHMDDNKDDLSMSLTMPSSEENANIVLSQQMQPDTTFNSSDYVFSSYFTSRKDPQRGDFNEANNFTYISTWVSSLKDLNIKGVIFHDNLSDKFMSKVENYHQGISFHKCVLHRKSTNDERFIHYWEYLHNNPNINRILCTDISDVKFQKNPFHLMDKLGDKLFVGTDSEKYRTANENGWIRHRIDKCGIGNLTESEDIREFRILYNAGIVGGRRYVMMDFLLKMTETFEKTRRNWNCNMVALTYVVHKYFDDITFTGFPLNNLFYLWKPQYQSVYISHK